ncbi:MAG TPA: hypothetical protein ENH52_12680 [Nitrospirae bacterium]|nr:hypothetical protein [Nitrospirota bacterium]
MKNPKPDLITRVEISIPSNKNTRPVLQYIRDIIVNCFDGATQIRSQSGGLWLDKNGKLFDEDIFLFIIYYNSEKCPVAEEILNYLAKMLIDTGESESWLIYIDAKRTICA